MDLFAPRPSPQQKAFCDAVARGDAHVALDALAGTGKTTSCLMAMDGISRSKSVGVLAYNVGIKDAIKPRLPSNAEARTLDSAGFAWVPHRSALRDWAEYRDEARVKAVYYPEVETALKAHTGADKVIVFDHTLRDSEAGPGRAELREPVRRVHDDQTFVSAPNRVRKHLSPEEAAWRLERRFAIVNFWRPVGAPVQQLPLAVCDARTIALRDLLPSDLVYRDWVGETYAFSYNPRHRWYWMPHQTPEEATLLKIYDSLTDGTARLTAHTAFEDPTSPPEAPPRRSIEVRTLLFW